MSSAIMFLGNGFSFKVATTLVAPEQVVVVHCGMAAEAGPLPRLLLLVPGQVQLMDDLLMRVVEHDENVGDHEEAAQRYSFLVEYGVFSYACLLVALLTLKVVVFAASSVLHSCGYSFTVSAEVRTFENVMLLKETDLTIRSPNLIVQVTHLVPTHLKIKIIIHKYLIKRH